MDTGSPRFQIDFTDLKKLGKSFLISAGAVLASLALQYLPQTKEVFMDIIRQSNAPQVIITVMTGLCASAIVFIKRLLSNYSNEPKL